jgi:hypothetical protein
MVLTAANSDLDGGVSQEALPPTVELRTRAGRLDVAGPADMVTREAAAAIRTTGSDPAAAAILEEGL